MSRSTNLNNLIFPIIIECLLQNKLESITVTVLVLIPYVGSSCCIRNNSVQIGLEEVVKAVLQLEQVSGGVGGGRKQK